MFNDDLVDEESKERAESQGTKAKQIVEITPDESLMEKELMLWKKKQN